LIPFPDKKYDVIVCDPAWQIKKIANKQRPNQVNMDYSMMSLEEIKSLPVQDIAKDDCWLFLWTTQKYLFESKNVLEHWGFNYLCMSVWEKTFGRSAGMPLFGFRWNAEFIAIGYKKKPKLFVKGKKLIPLVFQAENIKHSKKPDKFYELIDSLGSDKIDLFARNKRTGWDYWGDEL
jgi:N6-adenosine-specific RNA methylase IME4